MTRPRVVAFAMAMALVPALACGLGFVGTPTDGATSGGKEDAALPDGARPVGDSAAIDGATPSDEIPDADTFEVSVTPFDSGVVDAGCTPVTIDDPLSAIDSTRWITVTNLAGTPHPVVS